VRICQVQARAIALLAGLVFVAAGCQSQTPPQPPARVEEDAAARASAALEAGRHAEAIALFRRALERKPASVPLRFGLAVALSYMDRGAATPEFQWVLTNAGAGSVEAVEARAWLARAGALPETALDRANATVQQRQTSDASLKGRAVFGGKGEKSEPMQRMQLFLVGQPDSPTKTERYNLRSDQDGAFIFPNVVPGPYMLTNRIAGQPIWRLRVEIKPAEQQQLELTPANSVGARDDFPQPR